MLVGHWDCNRFLGKRNINCGKLRKIGKTNLLKQLIKLYHEKLGDQHGIVVIIPARTDRSDLRKDYSDLKYSDLKKGGVIDLILREDNSDAITSMGKKVPQDLIFADEVPDAEERFGAYGEFIAGFYSEKDEGVNACGDPEMPDLPKGIMGTKIGS